MKIVLDSNEPKDMAMIQKILNPMMVAEQKAVAPEVVETITAAPELAETTTAAPELAETTTAPSEPASASKADPDGWIRKDPNPANFKKVDPATKKATVLKMGFTPGTTVAAIAAHLECTEGNVLNHMSQLYNKHGFGYMRNTKTGEIRFLAPPKEQVQAAAVQPTVPATPASVETPVVVPPAPAPEVPAEVVAQTPAAPVATETPGVNINDFDELFSGSEDAAGVTDFLQ